MKNKNQNLEFRSRLGVFAALFFGGLVMNIYYMNITGWAISELTESTPGLLGTMLLFIGLIGMFVSLRKIRTEI
ncbi:hypothetical protein K0A97_00500 [Patescibacteria group bacterium]|nr:hypothetical protein [Patescibacteria group bacterium]